MKPIARLTLATAVVAAALVVAVSGPASAQQPKGKVSGGRYASPRGLFTVPVPKAVNWAGVPFAVADETETGDRNFDSVFFHVKDFGEVLVASVRRIPAVAREAMAADEPDVVARNLADKALTDWRRDLPAELEVVEDDLVSTPFGQAALRIYKATKGSLLQKITGASGPERFDVLIAVLAVRRNDHMISAIAENDAAPLDGASLRRRLQEFFSGLQVADAPPFDKK